MITKAYFEKELERLEKRRHDGSVIEVASLSVSILTIKKFIKLCEEKQFGRNNHTLGCELESIAQTLQFRGFETEADALNEVASKIK